MKCPYNISIHQRVTRSYSYDTDGKIESEETVLVEKRPLLDCAGKDCGAWQNGKCCYNNLKD